MVKIYDSEGDENPNGIFVCLSDYKELDEKYRSLVKRYAALEKVDENKTKAMNSFFDPHD